jgi:hypothetical protein
MKWRQIKFAAVVGEGRAALTGERKNQNPNLKIKNSEKFQTPIFKHMASMFPGYWTLRFDFSGANQYAALASVTGEDNWAGQHR